MGNADLAEVFSYTGQIPENPDIIIWSERMSAPEHIGHPFSENGALADYTQQSIL